MTPDGPLIFKVRPSFKHRLRLTAWACLLAAPTFLPLPFIGLLDRYPRYLIFMLTVCLVCGSGGIGVYLLLFHNRIDDSAVALDRDGIWPAGSSKKESLIHWKDIEVANDRLGKPYLILRNRALEIIGKEKISNVHLSISHRKQAAIAMVILEK